MKIEYTENPLCTKVFLDETETKLLRAKIVSQELHELLVDVGFGLRPFKYNTLWWNLKHPKYLFRRIKYAWLAADLEYLYSKEFEDRINEQLKYYIECLQDNHCGDCTCFPATCSKCLAEDYLEISTLGTYDKHVFERIQTAFMHVATCNEAIEYLKSHKAEAVVDWMTPYLPKWEEERLSAIAYLEEYKRKHLTLADGR